jgi:mercuric ion transport protein
MAESQDLENAGETRRQGLIAAGGVLGAIAASSCCILPLALFGLGITGVWIGNLAALTPYQPIIVLITAGFLGYGYYLVHWKPKKACAEGTACARPRAHHLAKIALWVATVLVTAAVAFPYVAPALLGV